MKWGVHGESVGCWSHPEATAVIVICKTTEERSSRSRSCCSASSCRRGRPVLWRLETSSWTCSDHKRLTLCCVYVCWAASWVSFFVVYLSDLLFSRTCVEYCVDCGATPLYCFWYISSGRELSYTVCCDDRFVNLIIYELCKVRNCIFHHSSRFSLLLLSIYFLL